MDENPSERLSTPDPSRRPALLPPDTGPRIQLRLHYEQPLAPQRLRVSLRGTTVLLAPDDGDSQRAAAYLHAAGIAAAVDDIGLLSFPVRDLAHLLDLPERVVVLPTGDASTLLHVLAAPEGPVLVTLDSPRVLNLSWVDVSGECNEPLDVAAASALLVLGVPVLADQETWQAIHASAALPAVIARARVNLDGFVELTTPVPQHVESLTVPGLFRIDDSRFGLPLASARHLEAVPGVVWDGPLPVYDPPPSDIGALPLVLSSASRSHLRVLVDRLAFTRSLAVVWPKGAGRRVFALSAVEALDGFPLVIVAPPSALWVWRRHLDLLGRRPSLAFPGDVMLVPYTEMGVLTTIQAPATVLFDDLDRVPDAALVRDRTAHLEGDADGFRISVSSALPIEDRDLYEFFGVLRPAEFRPGIPPASRYGTPSGERLREHTNLYVLGHSGTVDSAAFRRSEVLRVSVSPSFAEVLAAANDPSASAPRSREILDRMLAFLREGTDDLLGPKIPAVVEAVSSALAAGSRVDVLAGSSRCRDRLLGLLGNRAESRLRVHAGQPPSLVDADVVIVMDYPRSFYSFDDVIVEASDSRGPRRVVLVHADDTLEDRLAVLALVRSESAGRRDPLREYSTSEVHYLLGRSTLADSLL
jgi:hypothetical protein